MATHVPGQPRIVRHNSKWASERIGPELPDGMRVLLTTHRKTGEQFINIEDDEWQGITMSVRQADRAAAGLAGAVAVANERNGRTARVNAAIASKAEGREA